MKFAVYFCLRMITKFYVFVIIIVFIYLGNTFYNKEKYVIIGWKFKQGFFL